MCDIWGFTGVSGSGKTTAVQNLNQKLQLQGKQVGGIVTIGDFHNNKRQNFWVKDIATDKSVLLAQRGFSSHIEQGAFGFREEGMKFGNVCIQEAILKQVDVLIIDEIGPLELKKQGWFSGLQFLKKANIANIVFTSRPTTFTQICEMFFPEKEVLKIDASTKFYLPQGALHPLSPK